MRSATASSLATRSASGTAAQDGNASRALATALSTSSTVPSGQAATMLSSAGFKTLNVFDVVTALPPMVIANADMSLTLRSDSGNPHRTAGGVHTPLG